VILVVQYSTVLTVIKARKIKTKTKTVTIKMITIIIDASVFKNEKQIIITN